MPLKARSFLPYTLPGVLALLGLWWYSWRKKEQINRDDEEREMVVGLSSSPEEGVGKSLEATHGIDFPVPEPVVQEVVALHNTLTTASSEAALGTPLVVVEPVQLLCHDIAERDSEPRSSERVSLNSDSSSSTSPNHQKRPETAAVSNDLVMELDTSLLHEQSGNHLLKQQKSDSMDVLSIVSQTLDRPEPEGDNVLAVQFSENLQADMDSLSSTKNELISFIPKTLDLYSPVMSQQSLCTASPVLLTCPVSTSSPASNDSTEVHNQNGDLRHPAHKSNSMEELHCLAASLITQVLSSAAREVTAGSYCESLLRETPEEARTTTPALNGTEIMKDDCVSQVSSSSQSVPDQLPQLADQVTEVITPSVCDKSEMQSRTAVSDQQEWLDSKIHTLGEIVTATQDSGSIMCQSENGMSKEDFPSTCLSASLIASKDETECFSHNDQQALLKSTLPLPKIPLQESLIGTEDSGYSLCQLENGIGREGRISTELTAAASENKEDGFAVSAQQQQLEYTSSLSKGQAHEETVTLPEDSGCSMSSEDILSTGLSSAGLGNKEKQNSFALDDQLEPLESTSILPSVQAQEETVTGTEDSGCSTCQSEDGISTEDLLSTGLSAEPVSKGELIQTSGILMSEEKEGELQANSDEGELVKPLSTEPAATNCSLTQLNGVEALRNGTNEAEADQSGGSDVNSMDSMDSCLNLGEDGQQSGSQSTELIVWEIEVPRHLVGRLIGKKGRYVSFLKQTSGAKIYISTLPYTQEFQICHIEGSQQQVDKALALIGKKFKDLDLTNVYAPQSLPLTMPSLPLTSWLLLPTGVAVEVIVVNIVSAGHVFVQQHTHPTYHALRSLDQQMFLCYSQPGTPALPSPAEVGVICAAPVIDGAWWRAQVISFYKDSDDVEIRYVDYGGYERVKMDTLRQIRSDFVTLPFQGTEVLLDNITPLPGEDQFSTDANSALEEMTRGMSLLAQVTNYDNNTGLPLVQMWSMVGEELVLLNRTLTDRGLATWVDSF